MVFAAQLVAAKVCLRPKLLNQFTFPPPEDDRCAGYLARVNWQARGGRNTGEGYIGDVKGM